MFLQCKLNFRFQISDLGFEFYQTTSNDSNNIKQNYTQTKIKVLNKLKNGKLFQYTFTS